MNLSPTLESPVTRQEKMATVWDEAEVGTGAAGGPRSWAPLDGEEVAGDPGLSLSRGGVDGHGTVGGGVGRGPD